VLFIFYKNQKATVQINELWLFNSKKSTSRFIVDQPNEPKNFQV